MLAIGQQLQPLGVQMTNPEVLGVWVLETVVQLVGKYMVVGYMDSWGEALEEDMPAGGYPVVP